MPESLLTILKFCFLALLYLFFVRVLRAVWAELNPPRAAAVAPARQRGRARGAAGRSGPPTKLKVVEPTEMRGRTFDLALDADTYVSQLHARVFRRDGQVYVEDLGSTNGTYLNRKKVSGPMVVRRGDRLQIGKTVMELSR
jgi:pSer/pThr/pTyr-binding forkhead associated (FHA) protein